MKNFKINKEHTGNFKMNSEEHGFNKIVIGLHPFSPDIECVGRLVQVRKNSGAFGSDTVLIRKMDGGLGSWENQGFFSVSEDYKEYYESLFKDVELDSEDIEYSIMGKHSAKGFVVEGMDLTDGKVHSVMITTSS